jgi:AraC family transcriptional regulator
MVLVDSPNVARRLAAAGMFLRGHVDERLSLEAVASVAGFSAFHFHRIFRVAFGENVNAYVVRHRMQRAARELRFSDRSITEIGLRCGYDSPSAFGRAFLRAFGTTPSAYRADAGTLPGIPSDMVPPASEIPDPRVETYEPRPALGLEHVGPYDALDPVMLRLYRIAIERGFLPSATLCGLSFDSPDFEDHDGLRFLACVTVTPGADVAGARADGLRDTVLPAGKHAVFRHRGPYQRITHAYDRLVAAWILTGRVALRDGPFVNTYLSDPASVREADLECDLAIPIL